MVSSANRGEALCPALLTGHLLLSTVNPLERVAARLRYRPPTRKVLCPLHLNRKNRVAHRHRDSGSVRTAWRSRPPVFPAGPPLAPGIRRGFIKSSVNPAKGFYVRLGSCPCSPPSKAYPRPARRTSNCAALDQASNGPAACDFAGAARRARERSHLPRTSHTARREDLGLNAMMPVLRSRLNAKSG